MVDTTDPEVVRDRHFRSTLRQAKVTNGCLCTAKGSDTNYADYKRSHLTPYTKILKYCLSNPFTAS